MKRRFIVLVDSSLKEQNELFIAWIKEERLSWWHWIQNSWLLTNASGNMTAIDIRNKVSEIFPGANSLVIQLQEGEGNWAGFGPKSEKGNMFTWLKKSWSRPIKKN